MASTEEVAPDAGATVKETLDTANPLADGTKALTESQQIAEREGADGVERFERKCARAFAAAAAARRLCLAPASIASAHRAAWPRQSAV